MNKSAHKKQKLQPLPQKTRIESTNGVAPGPKITQIVYAGILFFSLWLAVGWLNTAVYVKYCDPKPSFLDRFYHSVFLLKYLRCYYEPPMCKQTASIDSLQPTDRQYRHQHLIPLYRIQRAALDIHTKTFEGLELAKEQLSLSKLKIELAQQQKIGSDHTCSIAIKKFIESNEDHPFMKLLQEAPLSSETNFIDKRQHALKKKYEINKLLQRAYECPQLIHTALQSVVATPRISQIYSIGQKENMREGYLSKIKQEDETYNETLNGMSDDLERLRIVHESHRMALTPLQTEKSHLEAEEEELKGLISTIYTEEALEKEKLKALEDRFPSDKLALASAALKAEVDRRRKLHNLSCEKLIQFLDDLIASLDLSQLPQLSLSAANQSQALTKFIAATDPLILRRTQLNFGESDLVREVQKEREAFKRISSANLHLRKLLWEYQDYLLSSQLTPEGGDAAKETQFGGQSEIDDILAQYSYQNAILSSIHKKKAEVGEKMAQLSHKLTLVHQRIQGMDTEEITHKMHELENKKSFVTKEHTQRVEELKNELKSFEERTDLDTMKKIHCSTLESVQRECDAVSSFLFLLRCLGARLKNFI